MIARSPLAVLAEHDLFVGVSPPKKIPPSERAEACVWCSSVTVVTLSAWPAGVAQAARCGAGGGLPASKCSDPERVKHPQQQRCAGWNGVALRLGRRAWRPARR